MMATESPVIMVESTNWPSSKGISPFTSQLHNMGNDELEVLLKTHGYTERNMAPNRSESAPPSIEGSFVAYGNLIAQQSSNLQISFGNSLGNSESEEQMRADPAYFGYYHSNVNLNPRLPPPIVAGGKGNIGNSRKLTSYDDSGNGSLHFARDSLSPHKEETEDDKSDNCADSGNVLTPGYDTHRKSLVDLIQEDFPRTPSPLYTLSHSSSHSTTADERIDHSVQSISLNNLSLSASNLPDSKFGSVNTRADMKTEGEKPGDKLTMLSGTSKPDIYVSQQHISSEKHLQPYQHTPFSQGTEEASGYLNLSPFSEVSISHQHQHFPQTPGLTPPLYTTATAYMTSGNLPYYPGGSHLSSGSVYTTPQYGCIGGYTLNSAYIPPFVAGYPAAGMHMQYNNGRSSSNFSSGDVMSHTSGDLLYQQQFYSGQQQGLTPQRMSMQMQYFQQQAMGQVAYGGQHGYFASTDAFGGQDGYNSFSSEKQATIAATYRGVSGRGAETIGSGYFGNPHMTQFRVSPFGSPLLPCSPVAAGANTLGERNELRLSQGGLNRNMGMYNGWQGQRGLDSLNDSPKRHSILEELKSFGSRKLDLSDIAGRVVEFSVDQHGSRFLQQKLEYCRDEEKESVFREIIAHASKLMTDVFGNYVIQKFFEHGSLEQRKQLADLLRGQILPLTFQMYGCRVIQKALEVIELDQKTELVHELDGHVLRCVRDQNGNHVIQKCIESIPTEKIGFILSSFYGEVANLSTHPYGCRVIQRVLEHCGDDLQSRCIIDEILESAHILAQDQYGNYVSQHVLEKGRPHERSQIISKLTGKIVQMSQHKYASNVVEKCLEYGDMAERERLIEEILGLSDEDNSLLAMMKDQFANYVVQKTLEISSGNQREVLLNRININIQALKKYTYGKHIVARFEQLCGEDAEVS